MEKCLHKSLVTNTFFLVSLSFLIVALSISLIWAESSGPETPDTEVGLFKVTEVLDGDTIKVEGHLTIRLLGVDTPEVKNPKRSVECFGKQASLETKKLLDRKSVILEKDITEKDKYGRLLRFIFLPLENGQLLFVNDYLIREGFAKVLIIPPDVKYTQKFLEAQREAREGKKGLWGSCQR